MSEQIFGIIIGAAGGVVSVMFGVVLRSVTQLSAKFDAFCEKCRERHEGVLMKEDFLREHIPLENKVEALHSRVDKMEVSKCTL